VTNRSFMHPSFTQLIAVITYTVAYAILSWNKFAQQDCTIKITGITPI